MALDTETAIRSGEDRSAHSFAAPRVGGSVTSGSYTARCHTSLDTVAALWRRFEDEGAASAYQRLDWAQTMVRHLLAPTRADLAIVELCDTASGQPVMLVPMVVRRMRTHKTIEWLNLGVCDYAGPILSPVYDVPVGAEGAMWAAVRSVLPRSDLIEIVQMAADIGGRRNPFVAVEGTRQMAMQSFGVALSGNPATILARNCSASLKKELRRVNRRMETLGEVRFVVPTTASEVESLYEVLIAQRLARFRELGRFDLLNFPHVRDFYRDAAKASLGRGPVQLFGVAVGDEWVASASGLVHGGAFHGTLLAIGSDRWRRCSPGLVIISRIMEWATAQGLGYLDFTVGDMPYKSGFGVSPRDLFELQQALTARGRIVLAMRRRSAATRAWAKRHPALFESMRKGMQAVRRVRARLKEGVRRA